jgi:hypothetical protein
MHAADNGKIPPKQPYSRTQAMSLPVDASTNAPAADNSHDPRAHIAEAQEHDAVEGIIHLVPLVLPLAGGVLMFLLAFIAIYMA